MGSWSAIVGRAGSQKAESARRVASLLREQGLRVGGFVQPEFLDATGELAGWDVARLDRGARVALARRSADPTLCDYAFDPSAFETAGGWLTEPGLDVVVVHAIGKLEAAGRGHWPAIEPLLSDPNAAHLVLCIRDTCLASIALRLEDPLAHLELPADHSALAELAARIAKSALTEP